MMSCSPLNSPRPITATLPGLARCIVVLMSVLVADIYRPLLLMQRFGQPDLTIACCTFRIVCRVPLECPEEPVLHAGQGHDAMKR
jgi:hypothetical protein